MKKAIIVDLDGTLANVEHRVHFVRQKPKDWKSFNEKMVLDDINEWCLEIVKTMKDKGYSILLLTGRDEDYRENTKEWLQKYNIPYDDLFMRKVGERREDAEIKEEIFENQIKPKYEVLFVLEDRLSVVKMWRGKGITCLQCDWGDF